MWSLKIVERYFAVGLPEFEACPIDTIYLQFPGDESDFGYDSSGSDDGTYALFVKLELIRRDIMKLTRTVALCEQPYHLLTTVIIELKRDLDKIGLRLSANDDHSLLSTTEMGEDSNLSIRKILARISLHQAYCDLYQILLPGYPEAAPRVVLDAVEKAHTEEAQHECLDHTSAIVQIIADLNYNSTSSLLLEFDTAICAYHAARLILFIARSGRGGDKLTPEIAINRVDICLVSVRRFFSRLALVRPIIDDMERLKNELLSQGASMCGFTSPPEFQNGRRRIEQHLSEAAKARQKLAVHSLLRRADCTDEV